MCSTHCLRSRRFFGIGELGHVYGSVTCFRTLVTGCTDYGISVALLRDGGVSISISHVIIAEYPFIYSPLAQNRILISGVGTLLEIEWKVILQDLRLKS